MPTYCIKTSDIPKDELPKWYSLNDQLDAITHSDTWSEYIFSYEYVYLKTEYEPLLIGSYVSPTNSLPLTLSLLKQLAFLKLTGDSKYDSNNTLPLLTST